MTDVLPKYSLDTDTQNMTDVLLKYSLDTDTQNMRDVLLKYSLDTYIQYDSCAAQIQPRHIHTI